MYRVPTCGLDRLVRIVDVTQPLVGRGEDRVGAARLKLNIDDAGLVVDVEDLLPGLAAIDGLEQAAFFAGTPQPSERADIHDVGVGGIDRDLADLERVPQSHVRPRLAAIAGLVDAIAPRNAVAGVGLAGADPDDCWIGLRDFDIAD